MKKLLAIVLLVSSIGLNFNFITNVSASSEYDTYFVVSAYYSPLPNQNRYSTNYYTKKERTYIEETILQGKGIRGASGKEVFTGMLAAPKSYSFGTKIKLEGLGIGSVEDRGGAIVPAGVRGHNYDRIDVWMGYGDEGLNRAEEWGRKTIKGKIMPNNTEINLNFGGESLLDSLFTKYSRILKLGIGTKSSNQDIIDLQTFLTKIGLYQGEITGKYDVLTINTVYDFQKTHGLINSKYDYGAGYWGTSTRKKIKTMYQDGKLSVKKDDNINENQLFTYNIGDESSEEKIKELQEIFKVLGLYKGEINGRYNLIKNVVIGYQLKNDLIKDESNRGAGYFGPKTRKKAEEDYKIALAKTEKLKEQKIKLANIKKEATEKIDAHIAQIGNPKKGEIGTHVRVLQKTLKTLGYFNVKDSAIFGPVTEKSILSYQIEKGIIDDNKDSGAGIYGPATKASIKKDLLEKLIKVRIKENELVAMK